MLADVAAGEAESLEGVDLRLATFAADASSLLRPRPEADSRSSLLSVPAVEQHALDALSFGQPCGAAGGIRGVQHSARATVGTACVLNATVPSGVALGGSPAKAARRRRCISGLATARGVRCRKDVSAQSLSMQAPSAQHGPCGAVHPWAAAQETSWQLPPQPNAGWLMDSRLEPMAQAMTWRCRPRPTH